MKPSDTDSVDTDSPRKPFPLEVVVAVAVATVIAAGGLFLILQKAAPIVAVPTATSSAPPKSAPAPLVASTAGRPEARVEVPSGPAVYRCKENGATTYSDSPCPSGKLIDARPAVQGFEPTPVRRAAVVAQSDAEVQFTPTTNANEQARRDARCAGIEKAIESIDVQARQGQTVTMQEWLRQERHKLVDERFALKC